MVGTVLNNTYRLESALTKGGMGQVFVGSHLRVSGRKYAIKQLHPELAVAPNFQTRFQREAEVMMTLEHPHIVRIEDFLIEGSTYYLVMEFVEGDDLDQRLRRQRKVPPDEAHRLTLELLAGLDYCHDMGVVHRDLKPSNLLLDGEGTLKITDFGIALQESSEQRLTNTGTILGTPDYMSPEQIVGKPLDGRSDIYAVGTILYEMLVGQPLFPRTDEEQGSYVVLFAHVHKAPPPIVDPNIPEYLRVVIEQCLQKDPENRYASAREMAMAMTDLAGSNYQGGLPDRGRWPVGDLSGTIPEPAPAIGTAAFHRSPPVPLPSSDDFVPSPQPIGRVAPAMEPAGVAPHVRAARSVPQPSSSGGKGRLFLVLLFLLLAGGAGAWFWPPGREVMMSWYQQIIGETPPSNANINGSPPDRTRERAPVVPRVGVADAGSTRDAGVSSERSEVADTPGLSPPELRRQPLARDVPDESQTKEEQDNPGTPESEPAQPPRKRFQELSKARWPLQVSKKCARLLSICMRHCLKSSDQPRLSFAMACRQRCWKMRTMFKIKGQKICPSFDGKEP